MIDTCGYFMLKFLIGFFNFLAFLAGLTFLIFGIVIKTHSGDSDTTKILADSTDKAEAVASVNAVAYIFVTVGVFVMLLGFMGCCGALTESRGMLITFCVIMAIMIIIEVIAICLPFAEKSSLQQETFEEDYEKELMANQTLLTKESCEGLNDFEKTFKCCFNETITIACNKTGAVQPAHCKPDHPDWKNQCKDVTFWEVYLNIFPYIGLTYFFIVILEIAAIIFSSTLIYLITKQRSQYATYT